MSIMLITTIAEAPRVIQVTTMQAILGIVVVIFGMGIAWGTLKNSVKNVSDSVKEIKDDIKNNISTDLKDVRERFAALEGRTAGLFDSHSPISLTDKGNEYLQASGLKEYIDSQVDVLIAACSQQGNLATPYDVQSSVFDFFEDFRFPEEEANKFKTYAFNQGISMDAFKRIGAIYFRDICLEAQGFKAEDLDNPKSN